MKKIIILLLTCFLLTGCTVTRIDNLEIGDLVSAILSQNITLENTNASGYDYYTPKGVSILNTTDNNVEFIDKIGNKYYLYVDVVSYYHKVESEYPVCDNCFYSSALSYNDKTGYLEINEINDKYFIEMMFHYAKVETYIEKDSLKEVLSSISTILGSIDYKDAILNTLIGENMLNYNELTFDIFKPERTTGNFSDYIEVYDKYEDVDNELPDEDSIDIGEES